MVKAVIFDLDDTLISEKQYVESGYRHISKLLSNQLHKNEHELYQQLTNLYNISSKNVFNRLFDKFEISYTKKDILQLVNEYRNHYPAIEFFDDVVPCLNILKEKGIKLGIITDGYSYAQRQKLKAVKAINYFDEIIITDELGKEFWKPHPKAFEIIKKKLKIEFNEMVYVGDNPEKDFYIKNKYPIITIRIHRGGIYKSKNYFKNIKEDYSIRFLSELNLIFRI